MNKHRYIFAKITPKAEFFKVAKSAIIEIIPRTLAEPGCLTFTLHEDEGGSLYLYEEWLSDDALQRHHDMAYTKEVFEAYKNWLVVTPEIIKMTKLA